ncbi:MAG: ABC transporter substrate-binding protein [Shinella sp.]|nr:ABC transporter substrate-binding protein [Shinella sp.]
MTSISNPFVRGYRNLHIERTLVLTAEGDSSLIHVPLHRSQHDLPSHALRSRKCLFNGDFALVVTDRTILPELRASCSERGYVRDVVYSIVSHEDGVIHHIGDTHAPNLAKEVVERLTFETDRYSRSWEISTAHISDDSANYLADLADIATPSGFLFVAFRIPYSPAIGVKLIATPWTDENLQHVEGIDAEELRRQHLEKGMPASLSDILHLAALADIRFLIFDADAPLLDSLPVYKKDAETIGSD